MDYPCYYIITRGNQRQTVFMNEKILIGCPFIGRPRSPLGCPFIGRPRSPPL